MNTTMPTDDTTQTPIEKPGAELAIVRESRGYTREYIAGKLHLRVRLIELLEVDCYDQMAGDVFVKGYIRAYAKLLGVPAEPYLASFNNGSPIVERKTTEKVTLWQNKRQPSNERSARWVTAFIILAAIAGISFWWQKNNDNLPFFSNKKAQPEVAKSQEMQKNTEQQITVTDITKLQSLFKPAPEPVTEKEGG